MNFKNFHPNIKFRMFDAFISTTVYNMMLPFLAIYFSQEFGKAYAGILLAIYFSAGILSSILGGHLSDYHGRRKILIIMGSIRLVSLGIITLSNSVFFQSPQLTFVMFVIINAGAGISMPTNQALLLDVSTNQQRKEIFGIEYWTLNSALFIGSVIGGFFFEEYKFFIFLICFSISLVSLLTVIFFIKESAIKKSKAQIKQKNPLAVITRNFILVSKNQGFILVLVASFLILSVETQAKNYFGVNLSENFDKIHMFNNIYISGTQLYGLLRAENALLIMLFSLLVSKWLKDVKTIKLLVIGITLNVAGYLIIVVNTNYSVLFIAMFLATVGEMIYWPVKKTYLSSLIPEDNKSAFLSISGLIGRGAAVTGSFSLIIGAYLNSYYIALILFIFGLIGMIIYLKVINNKKYNINEV